MVNEMVDEINDDDGRLDKKIRDQSLILTK